MVIKRKRGGATNGRAAPRVDDRIADGILPPGAFVAPANPVEQYADDVCYHDRFLLTICGYDASGTTKLGDAAAS